MIQDENMLEKARDMVATWMEARQKVENRKDQLEGEDLSHLKLMEAQLDQANLVNADLSYTYLIKANLKNANLEGADLSGTVLAEADLSGADLKDTELYETWLNSANLEGALNLTPEQLEDANIDQNTRLPDYIKIEWTSETTYEVIE